MKVLLIGPSGAGKSPVANWLAGITDTLQLLPRDTGSSDPGALAMADAMSSTMGCRIVEFTRPGPGGNVSIELWDVAGDQRYEGCWPAIQAEADGVLLMFNQENMGQVREAELWYDWFVKNPGIPQPRAALLGFTPAGTGARPGGSGPMSSLAAFTASPDAPEGVKAAIDAIIAGVASSSSGAKK